MTHTRQDGIHVGPLPDLSGSDGCTFQCLEQEENISWNRYVGNVVLYQ